MIKFAVDAMLGKTARKLRMAGFDAAYMRDAADSLLLDLAAKQNRIILTKDTLLYRRALGRGIGAMMPSGDDTVQHLLEIAEALNLGAVRIDSGRSRCSKCNGIMIPAESPHRGSEASARQCIICGKRYWHGSHTDNLQRTVSERQKANARQHGADSMPLAAANAAQDQKCLRASVDARCIKISDAARNPEKAFRNTGR